MNRVMTVAAASLLTASFNLPAFAADINDVVATQWAQANAQYKAAKEQANAEYHRANTHCKSLPFGQRRTCRKAARATRKAHIAHAKLLQKQMRASALANRNR